MEALFRARLHAAKILEAHLVTEHHKDPAWAQWKSFFLINALLSFLDSYLMIEEVSFDQELMKNELRVVMRSVLID